MPSSPTGVPHGCRHSSPSAKGTLPSSPPSIRLRHPCESLPEQQFLLAGASHTNSFEGPETLMTSHHGLYRDIPFMGSQIAKTQQNRDVLQIPADSRKFPQAGEINPYGDRSQTAV